MVFADLGLARRLEAHLAAAAREYVETQQRLYPAAGAAVLAVAGGYAVFTGAGSPVNGASGLGMVGPVVPSDVDALEAFYRGRGRPPRVMLCPLADLSLIDLLAERGYGPRLFLNTHVRPLTPEAPSPGPNAGVRVTVAGPGEAALWARTVARGFAGREDVAPEALEIPTVQFHKPANTCFLAWLDGEPAGGALLEVRGGVASFHAMSTRPAFRGRGVQAALLAARLAAAREMACDLALVETEPGSASERNVRRAGFRTLYTRVRLERR